MRQRRSGKANTPVMPAFGTMRQEDSRFEGSLVGNYLKKNHVAMYLQGCDVSAGRKLAGSQTGTREELGPEADTEVTDKVTDPYIVERERERYRDDKRGRK